MPLKYLHTGHYTGIGGLSGDIRNQVALFGQVQVCVVCEELQKIFRNLGLFSAIFKINYRYFSPLSCFICSVMDLISCSSAKGWIISTSASSIMR